MSKKRPNEIPFRPDPGPPPPFEPKEPEWPITKPEIKPTQNPPPAKIPKEIPPPPDRA